MANEMHEHDLRERLGALVASRFGGDYKAAFTHYDADRDGMIRKDELKTMLGDAGIAGSWSRWAWVEKIIDTVDANGDGVISWPEFSTVFGKAGSTAGHGADAAATVTS